HDGVRRGCSACNQGPRRFSGWSATALPSRRSMSSDGFPVLDTLLALRLVARTTLLFHLHGRRAVARATRAAMKGEFEGDIEACVDRSALLRVQRAVRRAVRIWPGRPRCLQLAL